MEDQTIKSEDLTVGELFTGFYLIPDYQREYVWGEKEVGQFFEDIFNEFDNGTPGASAEYFIGTVVVCDRDDAMFEVIDGQQRITTAFLTFCALRDYYKTVTGGSEIGGLQQRIAATDVDNSGRDLFRYRVILQYEDSGEVLKFIGEGKTGFEKYEKNTRSITNILNAYQYALIFLQTKFVQDMDNMRRFYAYFTHNVKLVRLRTKSVTHALKIFETINDRGVGLDAMDLLKNLMFRKASQSDFDRLKDRWKNIVDILHELKEKPLRFLRYSIFAEYGVERLREDEIYDWFVKNEDQCGYNANPVGFVDELLDAAKAYCNFLKGNDVSGVRNRYLDNIRYLSGAARQHLILLLAGRRLPNDAFSELCRHVENLFFAYIITREATKNFERLFAQWSPTLKDIKDNPALVRFVDNNFKPAKTKLAARFDLAFKELYERSLQQYRLKYLLAKVIQYIDERAWGSVEQYANLNRYINKEITLEHIFPQYPDDSVKAGFDKPNELNDYTYRLGNLTLLEKSINSAVGNRSYREKVGSTGYPNSNFLLNSCMKDKKQVGKDTKVTRAITSLLTFDDWDSKSIIDRQEMLTALAREVWDMR